MATPTLLQARSHYARQRRITALAIAAVRKLFARNAPLAEVVSTVTTYQLASAMASSNTVAGFANEQAALTIPTAFAGVSSAGFPISEPIVATIDRFVPAPLEPLPDNWWADATEFMASVEQLIASEIQDAGRSASQTEFVARPDWTNYVRMLNPPSCARCAILAGRIYRDLEEFERHPNCFPAGTVVSGPGTYGASRRWYEGELVVIRTAGGKEVSATANHPVLTDQGWVPASLLAEGGYVVSRASGDRSGALLIPDHDQMPARIEDLWSADGMSPLGRVPVTSEDFHGDGLGSSHVDVVLADSLLWDGKQFALLKHLREEQLPIGAVPAVPLPASCADFKLGESGLLASAGRMGPLGLSGPLVRRGSAGAKKPSLGGASDRHSSFNQAPPDYLARQVEAARDRVLAFAGTVSLYDGTLVEPKAGPPRWDAPAGEFSTHNRAGYAERGADLRERLTGQVELDRIVELRRVSFSGHVYNLTSSEGWYDANGLIVSNCDCVMVPVTDWQDAHDKGLVTSAQDAFDKGLIKTRVKKGSDEYRPGFSKADEQAIRDGADIAQVINAHRGMRTVDTLGHRVKATTVGTTRRSAWRKANPSRLVRLRPEAIYRYAKDREDAIRLLKLYGYIR